MPRASSHNVVKKIKLNDFSNNPMQSWNISKISYTVKIKL